MSLSTLPGLSIQIQTSTLPYKTKTLKSDRRTTPLASLHPGLECTVGGGGGSAHSFIYSTRVYTLTPTKVMHNGLFFFQPEVHSEVSSIFIFQTQHGIPAEQSCPAFGITTPSRSALFYRSGVSSVSDHFSSNDPICLGVYFTNSSLGISGQTC